MQGFPQYSVVMPTHRRAKLLARALASLKSQTSSTSMEIIVVSDCADAQTDAVCHEWLAATDTYIRRSGPAGPSISRNLALRMAKGRFILFLDDDDAWQPDLLACLDECEALQRGQAIYFNCTVIKEQRTPDGPVFLNEAFVDLQGRLNHDVYVKNQIPVCCYAFPRDLLHEIEFDPHMRAYEDWDFVLSTLKRQMPIHCAIRGAIVHEVDDSTTDRRGSTSAAQDHNAVLDYLYVYRRHKVGAELQAKRAELLTQVGMPLPAALL
jgi:glycosyltransferase involved in cell wall biosynthesis